MPSEIMLQSIVCGPVVLEHASYFLASLPPRLSRSQAREWSRNLIVYFLHKHLGLSVEKIVIDNRRACPPQLYCDGRPFFVSLAYTEQYVGVVFSEDYPVGIDIESCITAPERKACIDTAEVFFSKHDADQVREYADEDCGRYFLSTWVGYEAIYKCLGLSLREWDPVQEASFRACMQSLFVYHDVVGAIAIRQLM